MNSANKKASEAKLIRQAGHAPQVKPVVAQLDTGVTAHSFKRPNAPSAFRPQPPTLKAVQRKMANVALDRKPVVAPPIYHPQQTPRVLQTKRATDQGAKARQAPRQTVRSLVYPSEAEKLVQAKAILQLRKPPTAGYRSEQKRIAQPKMASTAPMHMQPKSPPVYRTPPKQFVHSVVQKMDAKFLDEEGLLPQETEDLNEFAQRFNMAYSGQLESRHTQAVTVDEDYRMMMYTQRWMAQMGEVTLPDPIELKDEEYVIGDQRDDENIHAEMLAISWYLQGKAKLPQSMGVSKAVCARCSIVLSHFNIPHYSDGTKTKNWTSPWRHAEKYPPKALKGKIPEIVKRGIEHHYKEGDWR